MKKLKEVLVVRETVTLKDWQETIEEIYNRTPASSRPKKGAHKKRSAAKRKAMALSCKKAWDEWIETGFLVVTAKGFKLCPDVIK